MSKGMITQAQLDEVIERFKEFPLNDGGLGWSSFHRSREEIDRDIEELRANLETVNLCADYLLKAGKRKTVNKDGPSSYGYKHIVEKLHDTYVTNGAFIAAALILGYEHTRNYNPHFNIPFKRKGARLW